MAVQQSQFVLPRATRVTLWLIGILAGLWVLFAVAINSGQSQLFLDLYEGMRLTASDVVPGVELWQVATYAWLHDLNGISHVLFNCLGLYFLGTTLERRWGGKTFLKFFVLTGVIAGVFSVLVGLILPGTFDVPIVGASGALFGIIAAYSILFPDASILLMFVIPVKSRYLVWIAIGIDIILFFAMPRYDVAIQTHIGGALAGWLLISGNWHPRIFWPKVTGLFKKTPTRPKLKVVPGGRSVGGRANPGRNDRYLN